MPITPNEDRPPRRSFLGRLAAGTVALTAFGAGARRAEALSFAAPPDETWLAPLKGKKHKQVFDAASVNGGFPLIYAHTYRNTMLQTYGLKPEDVISLVVLRHFGIPIGLNDRIWEKYKLGAMFDVTDPATKLPSTRNIFHRSREGDILLPDASIDRLIERGGVAVVCAVAIMVLSGRAAAGAGVTPEVAHKEWQENLVTGAHIVPSGVLAVGRAQEAGCSYCHA